MIPPVLIRARHILPICAPPIRDGVIRVEGGLIAEVRPAGAGDADAIDLGDSIVMPGCVNAHAHLELTAFGEMGSSGRRPGSLWEWIDQLMARLRQPEIADSLKQSATLGARMSIESGVTLVGDISRTGAAFGATAMTPLRSVCYFELISGASSPPSDAGHMAQLLDQFESARAEDTGGWNPPDRQFAGLSPHSLYNVDWSDLRRTVALAAERELPLTMHFAETACEAEWLQRRTGPLAEFLGKFRDRRGRVYAEGDGLAALHRSGMTHHRPLLAHCNYVDDAAIADLARARCHVAFCPRAHAYFGHDPHPWRKMLAAGINVCIGTDSLASNQSLSILDELRFLRRQAPDLAPRELLRLGTMNGAKALGLENHAGAICVGAWADLAILKPGAGDIGDPEAAIMDNPWPVSSVYVGGARAWPERQAACGN